MEFIKAVAVPNQPSGAYYSGKLQLIVPIAHGLATGNYARVTSNTYNGLFRVTDVFDNESAGISALYFGDVYFAGNDTGTLEKVDYNPIATKEVEAPATYAPGVVSDADYTDLIANMVGQIEMGRYSTLGDDIKKNYKTSGYGYTQLMVINAIKILKETGVVPMNLYGIGLLGHDEWVMKNFEPDDYVPNWNTATVATAPVTKIVETPAGTFDTVVVAPPPGVTETHPAVAIQPTNPNPGANISVNVANPYNSIEPEVKLKSAQMNTDTDYKNLIAGKIPEIKNNASEHAKVLGYYGSDAAANTSERMGYTQWLVYYAILLLKRSGAIPGSTSLPKSWIAANYPFDTYMAVTTPTVTQPVTPPVIEPVNPNPGATTNQDVSETPSVPVDQVLIDQLPNPSATEINWLKVIIIIIAIAIIIKILK